MLGAMSRRLRHRGPDDLDEVVLVEGGWEVGLAHTRLSILDLEGGRQPLSADGATIVFNGEIFNHAELRRALEAEGYAFRTRSDTEVLLRHWQRQGEDGVSALNGMFAFAIWDGPERRLTLARDRAGIKPLYYAELPGGGMAFASELSALLAHPDVPRTLDRESLASYLFSDYVAAPRTILRRVKKLPPGSLLAWRSGRAREPVTYWRLAPSSLRGPLASPEAEFWDRFTAAVRRQLVADVRVGVFLSGGLDSSLVAAAASAQAGRLPTFTIRFADRDFDESDYARQVARHLGTDHHEESLDEKGLLEAIDPALDHLDEPLADPSVLPTYVLSRAAARHVKVVLGGDGGDELWAGYPTYRAHRLARWIERSGLVPLLAPLVGRLPVRTGYQSLEWKLKRLFLRWDDEPLRRHLRWMSAADLPHVGAAFPGVALSPLAPAAAQAPPFPEGLSRWLALDFATYLSGSVLTKVDRMSMANGLEVRPPFLDNELVRWAFSLPDSLKWRSGAGKWLLRRVALTRLPRSIVTRPKRGFAVPLARWLRGPLQDRLLGALASSPLWNCPGIDKGVFSEWNRRLMIGREDHSKPLWSVLVLDHWMRKERIDSFS